MAAIRTSTRQAAQKAKEAISAGPDSKVKNSAGAKRKETTYKDPEPKRSKKNVEKPAPEESDHEEKQKQDDAESVEEKEPEKNGDGEEKAEEQPKEVHEGPKEDQVEEKKEDQNEEQKTELPKEEPKTQNGHPPEPAPDHGIKPADGNKEKSATDGPDSGVQGSQEREEVVPSNILEKGVVYFFYRSRVNVEEPQSMNDVARSFIVLRPTPLGAVLDEKQGSLEPGSKCRLLMLPKKKFPTTGKERDMGFVEKAGQTMKDLQENFIPGEEYQTSTQGERSVPEAKPYTEGVYAITSTKRASHLAYILTIPENVGPLQEDFGLHARGSWIVQSKNPKYPGPSSAQLPKNPEYPESVREKFQDYRWVPLTPEFIDYPNAQFLMVGEATDDLGKAATAESDGKRPEEEQPGEELEKLEEENKERVESLKGDDTVYTDLGLDAKNYPKVPTTWGSQ